MARYIDADKLKIKVSYGQMRDDDVLLIPLRDVYKSISNAPTADVVERENLDEITEAHERIGFDRGFQDGYAQAMEDAIKVVGINTWAGSRITQLKGECDE